MNFICGEYGCFGLHGLNVLFMFLLLVCDWFRVIEIA